MTPYYEDQSTAMYHADVLEFSVPVIGDILLTDPPYSRAGSAHTGRSSVVGKSESVRGSDQFWLHWFRGALGIVLERLSPAGCGFVFSDYRTIHLVERAISEANAGWSVSQCLVWDRASIGLGSPFRASHELIAFCRGPRFVWGGKRDIANVVRFRWPYGQHEHHPAEKPVGLLANLIGWVAPSDAIVFDPFMGSGSTLVAARQVGRRALGIEIEECYCEIAVRRLQQAVLPLGAAS